MTIHGEVERLAKGLVLHFLQGKTVDEAVHLGREANMPRELLDFPSMTFQATSAAGAVHTGERTLSQVLDAMVERGAPREEAECLVKLALDVMIELEADGGPDRPVPASDGKWFEYEEGPRANHSLHRTGEKLRRLASLV